MDIMQLLKDSWRITTRTWQVWVLMAGMFITFLPAITIAGGLGGLAGLVQSGNLLGSYDIANYVAWLYQAPAWAWVAIFLAALVIMVLTTVLSWILQAAAMRIIAEVAVGRKMSLASSLDLGRQRLSNIIKLSLALGLVVSLLALFPLILILALPSPGGMTVASTISTTISPLTSLISIAVLLAMMSIALDDYKPKAAAVHSWRVFRRIWWVFLLVIGLTMIATLILSVFVVPAVLVIIFALLLDQGTGMGILVSLACAGVSLPLFIIAILFVGIYTLAMYTLAYKDVSSKLDKNSSTAQAQTL